MRGKHTAMSHAFSDLMVANLLRIFNERNRRRRAAAIRAIYTKLYMSSSTAVPAQASRADGRSAA